MILFFKTPQKSVIATQVDHQLTQAEVQELCWLYGNAEPVDAQTMEGFFVGPRREMITPWIFCCCFERCRARRDASAYVRRTESGYLYD